jgi:PPM family protein phosphatase
VSSPRDREELSLSDDPLHLDLAAVTDIGTVRKENQDGWRIAGLGKVSGCMFLLADGMGGEDGGKEASATALDVAAKTIADSEHPFLAIADAFAAADVAVGEHPKAGGTTLVGAVLSNAQVRVANVGDSRAYVLHGSQLRAVTQDHSVVAEQVRLGNIGAEEAQTFPGRNLLTRAVTGARSEADFFDVGVASGDVMMLCSDGLWNVLTDQTIHDLLEQTKPAQDVAETLCNAALQAGSTDNVTIVICQIR